MADMKPAKRSTEEVPARKTVTYEVIENPPDADGDFLPDAAEEDLGTDPHSKDTDRDGRSDGEELLLDDTDPLQAPAPPSQPGPSGNPTVTAFSAEGGDALGFAPSSRPKNYEPASRPKGPGPDTDGDGLSDEFEKGWGSDPSQRDPDGDGLSDFAEWTLDTKPRNADSDGDGYADGEDLAFGDPLAWNEGGEARSQFVQRARELFEQEGSDRDHDLVRDYLEGQEGTKVDDPDTDNDGLGDMVELQLGTSPISPANGTADLDTARERLGERRYDAEAAQQETSGFGAPVYEEPVYEPAVDETAEADPGLDEPADF